MQSMHKPVRKRAAECWASSFPIWKLRLGDSFLPPPPPPQAPEAQPRQFDRTSCRTARTSAADAVARLPSARPQLPRPRWKAASPTFTYQPTKKRTLAPEVSPAAPKVDAASVDLADMFGELKHELEEDAAQHPGRSRDPLQPGRGLPRNGLAGRSHRRVAEGLPGRGPRSRVPATDADLYLAGPVLPR